MTYLRDEFSERLRGPGQRARLLAGVNRREANIWHADWPEWAHAGQLPPAGEDWRTWVLMAGRGFGKTLAGAQWIAGEVRAAALAGAGPVRIALVAATEHEARRLMVEGRSGLLALPGPPDARPRFEPSRSRLVWPDGSEAMLFSGANPEALRGPEHHLAWCDELAKWRHPQETWDMLQLGLRAGARPRALVTTTPRTGCEALKAILAAPGTVQTGGSSERNPHVPDAWLDAVEAAYADTALGRQELDGVLAEDVAGTLWPAALIERSRAAAVPRPWELARVAIGVDPPASAQGTCGIVACGVDKAGVGHVLGDHSAAGASPERWAAAVAGAVAAHGADRVIAEGNQGGEMVRAVLAGAGLRLPVRLVHAARGKVARAEPVAALFECGRMMFAGRFPQLEAELAGMIMGGGYEGPGRSPDRADAMVWAATALMLDGRGEPGVRQM